MKAAAGPHDRNRRNNVSIAIKWKGKVILVDAGKTFRDTVLRWFPKHGIKTIDCLLLTHAHADATGGLDDLRDFQGQSIITPEGILYCIEEKMRVITAPETLDAIRQSHSYVFEASISTSTQQRKVAMIDVETFDKIAQPVRPLRPEPCAPLEVSGRPLIQADRPGLIFGKFELYGLSVTLLPCYHGGDYVSYGFAFGSGKNRVVYLSDVSSLPESTVKTIEGFGSFRALIIDALHPDIPHYSHLSILEASALIERFKPEKAVLVGLSCKVDIENVSLKMTVGEDGMIV